MKRLSFKDNSKYTLIILKQHGISIPFVGSNNYAGTLMVGDHIKKKLNGRGRVIVIEGIRGVENADLSAADFSKSYHQPSLCR